MLRVLVLLAQLADAPMPDARPTPLDVAVGETVQREAGQAIGYRCDDPALVKIELVTVADRNVAIVTGLKAGTTQCRVGTDPHRPSTLYDVRVLPRRARARGSFSGSGHHSGRT